jgi:hypothetical protein
LTTYETEIIYHHVVVRVDRFGFGWLQRRYYRLLYSRRPGDHECGPGDSADDPAFNELTGLDVATLRRCQQGTGKSYGPVSPVYTFTSLISQESGSFWFLDRA